METVDLPWLDRKQLAALAHHLEAVLKVPRDVAFLPRSLSRSRLEVKCVVDVVHARIDALLELRLV